jgi:hypothetical protein
MVMLAAFIHAQRRLSRNFWSDILCARDINLKIEPVAIVFPVVNANASRQPTYKSLIRCYNIAFRIIISPELILRVNPSG